MCCDKLLVVWLVILLLLRAMRFCFWLCVKSACLCLFRVGSSCVWPCSPFDFFVFVNSVYERELEDEFGRYGRIEGIDSKSVCCCFLKPFWFSIGVDRDLLTRFKTLY
jgi:hypothetical protein